MPMMQLSNFHIFIFHDFFFLHIFFSHFLHVYSILWSFIFWDKGWRKLIIIIKAFLPLKVAGNYAVKQNSIVRLSAWKMQMSTVISNIFLSGGIEPGSKGNELLWLQLLNLLGLTNNYLVLTILEAIEIRIVTYFNKKLSYYHYVATSAFLSTQE